jgi:hypothetical protein
MRSPAATASFERSWQFEEATGLGVPAGWQPGDPGIRRDFSAVGKI